MSAKILSITDSGKHEKRNPACDHKIIKSKCVEELRNLNASLNSKLAQTNHLMEHFQQQARVCNNTVKNLEYKLEINQKALDAEKESVAALSKAGKVNETRLLRLLIEKDQEIAELTSDNTNNLEEISDLKNRFKIKTDLIQSIRRDQRIKIRNLNETCQNKLVSKNRLLEEQLNQTKNFLQKEKNVTSQLRRDLDEEIRTHLNTSQQLNLLDKALNNAKKDVDALAEVY